ncbi:MAG: translation initiation factor IF-2 [Xanthomonadaceae bacterium]|nr:translation initiation factor IF-2 [Rhodospirillaceae bacterium]NIA17701.1 translation initiation factor IF-2 [Xanthomonadaceae bacterium]
MNISELARKLRISPQELRKILSAVGVDIGAKAIKIDKQTAKRVLNDWNKILIQYKKLIEDQKEKEKEKEKVSLKDKEIKIPSLITVKNFASLLSIPINKLMEILIKNGIFISLNEKIDYDTAAIIAMELGAKTKKIDIEEKDKELDREKYLVNLLKKNKNDDIKKRPPVVVVMGHVDHGKTKLLDMIRKTNVIGEEAGGITQHIGAYQINRNNRLITFIDTPGHEAFTAMRSRGASIADIAILVVAADDGVKPQTIEAIKIIEKSKIPFVVAINKIDKKEANVDKVKKELASHNVLAENWGGKIVCVPISAKQGIGINELLDMLLLTIDIDKERLDVDYKGKAIGTIIESSLDKGEGNIMTVLVQKGILNKNDLININKQFSGKIRMMRNYKGEEIEKAPPSTPVRISGIKNLAQVGDILEVVSKRGKIKKTQRNEINTKQFIYSKNYEEKEDQGNSLNILLKSDVLGSTEVIIESLEKIESNKIKIKIINRGLGNITESDILQTEGIINNQQKSSQTILVGFNVKSALGVDSMAKEKNINIKLFQIIYDLLDYVKKIVKEMIGVQIIEKEIAKLSVLKIFKTEKKSMIIGGKVLSGKVEKNCKAEIWRDNNKISEGEIKGLQSGKQEVSFVEKGQEFGMVFVGEPIIHKDDKIVVYKKEEIIPKV